MTTSYTQVANTDVDSSSKVAHAFLVVPNMPGRPATSYALARFVLSWQIRWLRRNGMAVTLVTDDTGSVLVPTEVTADGRGASIEVMSWRQLEDRFLSGEVTSEGNSDTVLLMLGAMLLDCDPGQMAARAKATDRTVAVVRQRHGPRLPVAYCCSSKDMAAWWLELHAAVRTYAGGASASLPVPARARKFPVRGVLLRSGDDSEMRAMEALWPVCARRAGLAQIPGSPSAFHVIGEQSVISASVRLCGPVCIEEAVIVEEHASVGPWVLLERGCRVGQSVNLEVAVIGAGASIESKGCAYASIVSPRAYLPANLPVLKAHFSARDDVPQLLPNIEAQREPSRRYLIAKRLLDLVLGVIALTVLSPLLCLAMLLCLVTQGWPIFFLHERIGISGKRFRVLKLRTMRRDAHLPVHLQQLEASDHFKIHNDPRVTPVGRLLRKSSIDELPQLLNVLAGQMSIVGPRPIVPKETARFGVYAHDLLRVKPGMTGLWQVRGRSNTTYARRVMLDVQYGDRCTLWLDLVILLRTIPAVLFLRGSV